MSVREPAVAGMFYPREERDLKKLINSFLDNVKISNKQEIVGAIVPHAGYFYSGKTAAYVYKLIKDRKYINDIEIEVFVIFGTNHSEQNKLVLSKEDFSTPFGIVKNSSLTEEIFNELKKEKMNPAFDGKNEHSIEVQLPFLQIVSKNFEIIPILIRDMSLRDCKKVAEIIFEKIKDKKVFVLGSSDFTHYGENYGFFDENYEEIDREAIEQIVVLDNKFLQKANETTICGKEAIACCMELSRLLGAKEGRLLNFTNSAQVSHDKSNVVDYASIVFMK